MENPPCETCGEKDWDEYWGPACRGLNVCGTEYEKLKKDLSAALLQFNAASNALAPMKLERDEALAAYRALNESYQWLGKELGESNRLVELMKNTLISISSCPPSEVSSCEHWAQEVMDSAHRALKEVQQQGKRKCVCGIALPAPGSQCANCGKVNIRGAENE